ncbi:transcriptional regulator [Streptomyces sp. NRRL F-5755]|uniref:MmyB family transcriptional regulator n=1 Tax=Streptomyces sp. NRRL F-5755 TaxID=1519475 RepID=UPI001F3681F5|nr:transcriptional regulator [Streptomyces sp. NRRL F-5755]
MWQTMCLLGFYTGLRWGELSGLHRHRIDQRRSRLFVVEVNTRSGIKEYPKSSKSRREVPLPSHVLEVLERHIHRLDRDAVVFTTLTKGRSGRLLTYLHTLVGVTAAPSRRHSRGARRLRPGLHQLIDALDGEPVLVLGRRSDVLAANRMAKALFTDFDQIPVRHRNYARWMFLGEEPRSLFVDWEDQARAAVESLRLEAGRDADDQATNGLIAELREKSTEFDHWWEEHRVHQRTHGSKRLHHALVGELTVEYETLTLPGDPDTTLFVYTAEPGSSSGQALDLLAMWTLTGTGTPRTGTAQEHD